MSQQPDSSFDAQILSDDDLDQVAGGGGKLPPQTKEQEKKSQMPDYKQTAEQSAKSAPNPKSKGP